MALILNIDIATESGSICVSRDGAEIAMALNKDPREHASWLHPAIEQTLSGSGLGLRDLQAISVTGGPGSYTGLRVGMASAKGLCYALDIPMIMESTLTVMALAARQQWPGKKELICPMIDARRMEVFTALYDPDLEIRMDAVALILEANSFSDWLSLQPVLFFGSGSKKWQTINTSHGAFFTDVVFHAGHLGILAEKKFSLGQFADLAYSEPLYLKEFHTHRKK
jgi:tRNA threonylcarbamoyladenosine biosynthesis protein TsaB